MCFSEQYVKIEKANAEDASTIAAIEQYGFDAPWTIDSIKTEIEKKHIFAYILFFRSQPAAFIIFSALAGEAELLKIAVIPDMRKRGLAGMLIDRMIEKCRGLDVSDIFLEVNEKNTKAISLYEKNGFDKISIRKNYYNEASAIICRKVIQ